jgi:hypothetical protein
MVTVAIIHAAEDALPARALAEKLRLAKLTVVLEKSPGEEQRNAAKEAKAAVALWSPRSVSQQAVIDDATFARGKTKLIHASMQNAALPDAFRSDKSINLTGWRGEDDFPAWRELAKLVTEKAGVSNIPPPAPKPPSGFFQPGAVRPDAQAAAPPPRGQQRAPQSTPPPRQQQAAAPRPAPAPRAAPPPRSAPPPSAGEESRGNGGMMMIAAIVFVVVALAGGGGYWFWSQQQNATSTSAAWESVDTGSADALRAFIDGDPGEYREEAQQALGALEERSYEAASDSDTIEAFEAFLNDFPDSDHALAARGRIAELQAMPQTPVEGEALPVTPDATAPNPDLVPPGTTTPDGGPATLTPPSEPDTTTPPDEAPTN